MFYARDVPGKNSKEELWDVGDGMEMDMDGDMEGKGVKVEVHWVGVD